MAVMAKWNGHKFEVSPSVIRSFMALSFKGGSETEEKTAGGQKYVSRKNGSPLEISLTAVLDRRLGCDVRKEAAAWTEEARAGKTGYFYVREKSSNYKLTPCKMMLVEAAASEVEMTPTGRWVRANVQLKLKQCGSCDGESSGSSSGGGGAGGGSSSGGSSGGYTKRSVVSTTPSVTSRSNRVAAALVSKPSRAVSRRATVSSAVKDIKQREAEAKSTSTSRVTPSRWNLTGKTTSRVTPSRWNLSTK